MMKNNKWVLALALSIAMLFGFNISAHASNVSQATQAYKNGNYKEATVLLKKACDDGNAKGCNNLGLLYRNGQGVTWNYAEAKKLFKKACDGGNAKGCINLGDSYAKYLNNISMILAGKLGYSSDIGTDADIVVADKLYEKACDLGDADECYHIADEYVNGWEGFVGLNKIKAFQYLMKAVKMGNANAQHDLDILCKESPWACK